MSQHYRLRIARPAVRALTEALSEKVAVAAYQFITGVLLDDPQRVGKPLDPPMTPAWTARRGSYRILYLIDVRRASSKSARSGIARTRTGPDGERTQSRSAA